MAKNYSDCRAAVAAIGAELARRGWTLYGWHADQSDSMTDYYCPERWDGVAEKEGAVCVVDCRDNGYSGGRHLQRYVPGEPCDRCHGAKADPAGWTFRDAKENPHGYNNDKDGRQGVSLFPSVVSPIPFFGACHNSPSTPEDAPELSGRETCRRCHGRGHMLKPESYVEPWPAYHANPAGRNWHVERNGVIVAHGTGAYTCGSRWNVGHEAKRDAIVDRIEAAATPRERNRAESARVESGGVEITEGKRPGFVDVRFASKPAADIIAALKGAGFRWAPSFGCWYGPADSLPQFPATVTNP